MNFLTQNLTLILIQFYGINILDYELNGGKKKFSMNFQAYIRKTAGVITNNKILNQKCIFFFKNQKILRL